MKPEFRTTRRRVLQLLAAMAGGASLPLAFGGATGVSAASDRNLDRAIDALIPSKVSAAVIGTAYLRQFDEERQAPVLQAKIYESIPGDALPLDEHTLLRRIAADFEQDEIVKLEGWYLSRTEARLCALCAAQ